MRYQGEASKEGRKPGKRGSLEAKLSVSWRKAENTVCSIANQLNKMRAENGSLGFNNMEVISDLG